MLIHCNFTYHFEQDICVQVFQVRGNSTDFFFRIYLAMLNCHGGPTLFRQSSGFTGEGELMQT